MIENVFKPILMIGFAVLWLKWLYKVDRGFLGGDDLFSKSKSFKGWMVGVILLIGGVYLLIIEILKYI
jgi:Na+-translocating ferredoxin:NAD+ oxidoreductase RnfD subunit